MEAGGLLVGVGDDEKGFPVLKIWDLTRDEKKAKGGGPVLLRDVRIQHGSRRSMVSYRPTSGRWADPTGDFHRIDEHSVASRCGPRGRNGPAVPASAAESHDESYGFDVFTEAAGGT